MCRDAKLEKQRRDQRNRKHGSAPQGRSFQLEPSLARKARPLREVLEDWPLEQLGMPPATYRLPIPRLDLATQSQEALRLRHADQPFILYNIPDLTRANRQWGWGDGNGGEQGMHRGLEPLFGDAPFGVTRSNSSSFLYPP